MSPRHSYIRIFLLLSLLFGAQAELWAEYPTGTQPLVDLNGRWVNFSGKPGATPFIDFKTRKLNLFQVFDLPLYQELPDSLELLIEGPGQSGEIWLNDRLLDIIEKPLETYLIPLHKSWLKGKRDTVSLKLSDRGESTPYLPMDFVGVSGNVAIYPRGRAPRMDLPVAVTADTVMALAWWPYSGKFSKRSLEFRVALNEIRQNGIDKLYFTIPPGAEGREIARSMGFSEVKSLEGIEALAFYRAYPVGKWARFANLPWWRTDAGETTSAYGQFISADEIFLQKEETPNRPALLILLLIPWVGLLILKLGAPRAFSSLGEYLVKTKIQIDLIGQVKFLKPGQSLLMTIFRLALLSIILSVYLYYFEIHGNWDSLNLISDNSLLYQFTYLKNIPLGFLFLYSFLGFGVLNLLKYFFLGVLGWVYRIQGLSPMIRELDILSSFPVILALALPPAFLFFSGIGARDAVLIVWQVLIIIYFLRRWFLVYFGLSQLFSFSSHIKFLYICALEILPWVILL